LRHTTNCSQRQSILEFEVHNLQKIQQFDTLKKITERVREKNDDLSNLYSHLGRQLFIQKASKSICHCSNPTHSTVLDLVCQLAFSSLLM